jgi:hypothetical protein
MDNVCPLAGTSNGADLSAAGTFAIDAAETIDPETTTAREMEREMNMPHG